MSIDRAAVGALDQQAVDWRYKSMPPDAHGLSVAGLGAQRRDLFEGGFGGPILTLDRSAMEANQAAMSSWCERRGVLLAPHGKTTMSPELFAAQLDSGAWGITAATVWQARMYRAFGVQKILIANEVVDEAGLAWIARETTDDPDCRIIFWVDSLIGVQRAAAAFGATRGEVLVDLGAVGARTGCRTLDEAREIAIAVAAEPALRLAGVAGYEGIIAGVTEAATLVLVNRFLTDLAALALSLGRDGLFDGEVIVSAGGSTYFDRVVEIFAAAEFPIDYLMVLRSGCYLTHDHGLYEKLTPSVRGVADSPEFVAALRIWAQVSSRPEPGLALLTMGKRDVSYDSGYPKPQVVRRSKTSGVENFSAEIFGLNDQHAYVRVSTGTELQVGDWVGCGISHPCSMFDRWRLIPLVEGTTVVDLIQTFF